jgi:hypothetical protein
MNYLRDDVGFARLRATADICSTNKGRMDNNIQQGSEQK